MKPIEIEKVTKVTHYEAIDGTTFTTEEECQKYEDTAKCALLTRYKCLVKRTDSESYIFNTGNDEFMIDILKPLQSSSDIDIIIQLHKLYNSYRDIDYYNKLRENLSNCLTNNDTILIGRGAEYDNYDCFCIVTTLQELTNRITKEE